jgi:hypothetical protein
MVIDAKYRKCVVFLFADVPNPDTGELARTPAGTAFLVGIPVADERFVRYLVTARHVVTLSRKYGSLFARIHLMGGSATVIEFPHESWHQHHSTEVAAALLRTSAPLDHVVVSTDQFEVDSLVAEHLVGIGDEVFFIGLFSEHPGSERNQPIARFGTIALMPEEKILVDVGDSQARISAYLVEARSWGGHSGSPAFVYFPPDRFGDRIQLLDHLPVFLLGLVQGHYSIKGDVKFVGDIGEQGSGQVSMNAGIAAVVPAQDILDLLMSEAVADQRNQLLGRIAR